MYNAWNLHVTWDIHVTWNIHMLHRIYAVYFFYVLKRRLFDKMVNQIDIKKTKINVTIVNNYIYRIESVIMFIKLAVKY